MREYYSATKKDTHYNMDELWKHYIKWKKWDTKGHIHVVGLHLYGLSRTGKPKTQKDQWLPEAEGSGGRMKNDYY